MIKLGAKVKDPTTGFEGIAVARTEWVYGCLRWGVQSEQLKDGIPVEEQWFDDRQLVVVTESKAEPLPITGGPRPRETG